MAENGSFSILTYNCNGLNDIDKRRDVFNVLRDKQCNIYFLQETHLREMDLAYHRASWGLDIYLAGHETNRGGCAILMNNNFDYKVTKVESDPNGQYIFLNLETMNKKFLLANVYGPSAGDNPDFFETIRDKLEPTDEELLIMAGDWNCVLDLDLDRKNYVSDNNRPRTRLSIRNLMNQHDLFDVFREVNGNKRSYTWRRFNSLKQARLDYFLISEQLIHETKSVVINSSYRSDHSPVILNINKTSFKHDRTFWKFNNSLLYDKDYVTEIKSLINRIKGQYCSRVYNLDNIDIIPNDEISFTISDRLFLETLLLEIRGKSIAFATNKKRKENEKELDLNNRIDRLERNVNEHNIDDLETLKLELQEIRNKKMQGITIRSKVRWIAEGEKVSKYFCNMESRKFTDKSLPIIEKENGTILTSQKDIREEVKLFYKNLYKKREDDNSRIEDFECPKLTDEEKVSLESVITWNEMITSLKSMKPNKSPGPDGFTAEFFKFFINDIGHFLLRSFNEGFDYGEMSVSLRQGSITLIPKENKSKRFVKNLRPISLLSVAYKIVSGCISNRLKEVLPNIIHSSQYGFVQGRQMTSAIRNIYDSLIYADNNNLPGMILSIDIEKAFDSVSWSFLYKALEFFNFGPTFIHFIKTLYSNISSCVSVNGQYTEWFPIERGVRQGDPSSPYLYLVCAEILSLMIRNNNFIKGIDIRGKENLLTQFADDTTLCLDGTERSFEEAIRTIRKFAVMSGLRMNNEKTQIIFIGSLKNSNIRYMRDENFIWNPGTWKILGILFSTNTEMIVGINYQNKLEDIRRILNRWKKRKLTPFGKITIIKSLAVSKLTHLFLNLPDPSREFLDNLDKELMHYLWEGKPSKIKRSIIYKEYKEGGLRMCNVKNFIGTLKISWVKKIDRDALLSDFIFNLYPQLSNLNKYGSEYCLKLSKEIDNQFWKDVLKHLYKLYEKSRPVEVEDFLADHIFYNKHIVRDHKYLDERQWVASNIYYIHQLVNDNGEFMNFHQFRTKFPALNTNFLTYYGILNAIKRYMRLNNITLEPYKGGNNKTWILIGKGNKCIQSLLNETSDVPTASTKWSNLYTDLNWEKIFTKIYITTGDVQLRWFQFRLIHRLLPTQRFLYLRKLKEDPICNFCNENEQTLDHLFYDCSKISTFWENLVSDFKSKCNHCDNLTLSKKLVIFGVANNFYSDKVFDLIILIAKFFIYKNKLDNSIPTYNNFAIYLKNRYRIEKYLACVKGLQNQFQDNWSQYEQLVL